MRARKNDALDQAMQAAAKAALDGQRTDQIYGVREGDAPICPWPAGPCRIIFLDFDGVLNCEQSNQELGTRYRFARSCVAALNLVLRAADARIVITSSWRENWTLKDNAQFLERDGVLPGRVLGKTPSLGRERGIEIDTWLRSAPYAIESFVILDDRDDMAMHRERLIQVDPQIGLTGDQARQAVELLSAAKKPI
ncbi:MAG TPA: HAD domain-containing protein [Verrucomicrobiae bacterium]|nr:HAD domain-containing protein [Verrucomicrobiae bacterium]